MTTAKQAHRLQQLEWQQAQKAEASNGGPNIVDKLFAQAERLIQSGRDLSYNPKESPFQNIAAAIAREDFEVAREMLGKAVKSMNERELA